MGGARSLAKYCGLSVLCLLGLWGVWYLIKPETLPDAASPMAVRQGEIIHVKAGSPLSKRLVVEPVTLSKLPHLIEVPAELTAAPGHDVKIYPPVTGRITDIIVQPGQTVQKGEILGRMLSGDLAQAQSDQQKAAAALKLAQLNYDRIKAVMVAGGSALKDIQSARNDLAQAQAEARRAEHHLEALDGGPNNATNNGFLITAPVDGVVSSITAGLGQQVTDTSNPIMELVDLSSLWVVAHIPEALLPQLRPNMVLSASFDGQNCSGPVTGRNPVVQNDTRRTDLYLRCENRGGTLHPGQFTTAIISIPERQQLILSKTALVMNNEAVTVMIETASDTYRRRQITISYDEGPNVRIVDGLKAGERVVTHGAILLNDY